MKKLFALATALLFVMLSTAQAEIYPHGMTLNVLRVDDGSVTVELINSTQHLYRF